jgi:PAS domain S-box-containing protein
MNASIFRASSSTQFPPQRRSWNALIVFVLCLSIGAAVVIRRAIILADNAREHTQAKALAVATAIEQQLVRLLDAADVVAALVRQGNGQAPGFQQIGADLLASHPGLAVLELQPAGVTSEMVPRAGTERAVGRKIFQDPVTRPSAAAAYNLRRPIVAGPVALGRGEPGLLGILPVYLRDRAGQTRWWGFVTATIRLGDILRNARLADLNARGYDYHLYAAASPLQPAASIASSTRTALRDVVVQPIRVRNLELRLALQPKGGGRNQEDLILSSLFALAIATLLAGLVRSIEKRREAALAIAEANGRVARGNERFRALLEAAPDALVVTDRGGCIQLVNAQAERLFGWRREELVGQPVERLLPDRSRKAHVAQRDLFLRAPRTRMMGEGLELFAVRKDGTEFPAEVNLSPLDSPEGKSALVCSSVRDISERRKQQAELVAQRERLRAAKEATEAALAEARHAEERSRLVLESAAEGIFGVDTEGRVRFVNPAACRLLGYAAEELIGQPEHALIHHTQTDGRHYSADECPISAAFTRGETHRVEDELLWRKDGSGFPAEYGATPILKDGAIVGAVISFIDITERKRAQAELADRLALNAALLDSIPYPMFVKDAEGRFRGCNRAYEAAFGTTRDALCGRTVLDLDYLPAAERERFHTEDLAVIRDASRRSYELPITYADGQTHITLYSVDGFRLADGRPGGLIGLLVDITESKRLEAELVAAREAAEEATRMKSMFLANMSHEIRTPMNAIIGLAHLALKTPLTARQRDYVSKIRHAGTSLLSVINDILDFSKIEAGRLELEAVDFGLDDVIATVSSVTGQKANEKGIEFLVEVSPAVPQRLVGDPLRLGQILTNLVSNAVKFTERGEIRVQVELLEQTERQAKLQFTVRDTGPGLTPEQAARLFQPFTQADMSTTRKHGGTGLGLTICQRLVELMGGQIGVEGAPGAGSTFAFSVRLGAGTEPRRGRVVPESLQRLHALVVDDHTAAREVLVNLLRPLLARVDAVASGSEAVAAVRDNATAGTPYGVVFLDWRMPGMDGLEAARLIKSAEVSRPPAIIIVTAFGREEVREEAEALDVEGFLVKPVTASMLVDALVAIVAPARETAGSLAIADSATTPRLDGAQILVVEDNEINQQVAIELLESVGARVTLATNGREAVEMLMAAPGTYHLALMDLQMPEMDGYQATAKIRSDERFARLPIIAMTAHATADERQRCLESGMNAHLAKPIDPTALYETCRRFWKTEVVPSKLETTSPADVAPASPVATPVESAGANGGSLPALPDAVSELEPPIVTSPQTESASGAAVSPTEIPQAADEPTAPSLAGPAAASEPPATPEPASTPKPGKRRKRERDDQLSLFAGEMQVPATAAPADLIPSSPPEEAPTPEPIPQPEVPPAAPTGEVPVAAQDMPELPVPQVTAPAAAADAPASPPQETATKPVRRTPPRRREKETAPSQEPPAESPAPLPVAADLGLPPIEGLRVEEGLQRLAGNQKLYLKLLRQFVEQQSRAAEHLRDLLVQGRSDDAAREAHNLKGVAGNLGAPAVQAAAAALERAIREPSDPAEIELLWAGLDRALSALMTDLKPALKPKEAKATAKPSKPPPPFEPAQFRKALNEILPLLTDSDPGAADCLEANRDAFRSAFAPDAFAEFESAAKAYQFDEALEQLKKAARRHGIS